MNAFQDLPTPSLILDLDKVRANIALASKRARALGFRLRPHVKTHKCLEIGRMQVEGHFGGITVSTLAEGFAFAEGGFGDILYAVPIEPGKFARAAELARRCGRLAVITDAPEIPELLNATAEQQGVTFEVFIEVDTGDGRSGVSWESRTVTEIARKILKGRRLRFGGLLTHAGHTYGARNDADRLAVSHDERDRMATLVARLAAEGIDVPTVSLGSTPALVAIDELPPNFEVRAGNYIFFDAFQAQCGTCPTAACALTVLAAVVHRDFDGGKVIVDAGAIALSKDIGAADFFEHSGYGMVLDLNANLLGLHVAGVSQEHGKIFVKDRDRLGRLPVGTRLRILANHSCLTAAQHDRYYVMDGGAIVDEWPIHRGW